MVTSEAGKDGPVVPPSLTHCVGVSGLDNMVGGISQRNWWLISGLWRQQGLHSIWGGGHGMSLVGPLMFDALVFGI